MGRGAYSVLLYSNRRGCDVDSVIATGITVGASHHELTGRSIQNILTQGRSGGLQGGFVGNARQSGCVDNGPDTLLSDARSERNRRRTVCGGSKGNILVSLQLTISQTEGGVLPGGENKHLGAADNLLVRRESNGGTSGRRITIKEVDKDKPVVLTDHLVVDNNGFVASTQTYNHGSQGCERNVKEFFHNKNSWFLMVKQ